MTELRRAKYRVVYKSGKARKTVYKFADQSEVIALNEDTTVLELRDQGQVVFSINFDIVFLCELVEFMGPGGGEKPVPAQIMTPPVGRRPL